jgi:hypothetical protein
MSMIIIKVAIVKKLNAHTGGARFIEGGRITTGGFGKAPGVVVPMHAEIKLEKK